MIAKRDNNPSEWYNSVKDREHFQSLNDKRIYKEYIFVL